MTFCRKISRFIRYLHNGFLANFYEPGWRTYVQYNGGRPILLTPAVHSGLRQFVADPFLFRYDGANWLFYETVDDNWKGKIGCFKEEDGRWVSKGIVLERPWHMSYPQVFEEDGHVYMIPEQSALGKGNVSIYEATDFPGGWVLRAVLIDRPFADATLVMRNGHYYMACYTLPPHESAELWHSETLWGPWMRHPMWNRINQSCRLRRCGGSFAEFNGELCRVAQDCNGCYGKRLFKIPIEKLTPTEYQEGCASILLDQTTWPHKLKHTFNLMDVDGQHMSTFDTHHKVRMPIADCLKVLLRRINRRARASMS